MGTGATVTLNVVEGPQAGNTFVFDSHDTFLCGRAKQCHVCVSDDTYLSAYHFLLETNPPQARLRDLGSLNGTWVNDVRYGGRQEGTPRSPDVHSHPAVDLRHEDRISVGKTVFQVVIERPPHEKTTVMAEVPPEDVSTADKPMLTPVPTLRPSRNAGQANRDESAAPVFEGFGIVRKLGKGGMGSVYLGKSITGGELVAIKVIYSKVAVTESARKNFLREMETLKNLEHGNIVRYIRSGSQDTRFWFVMEYCDGGSLDRIVRDFAGKIPIQFARPIMLQVLDGMAHAHQQNLVHRDIKPQNIIVQNTASFPVAKICDFGLAKSFDQAGLSGMTLTGVFAGTMDFMPREQITNYKYLRPCSDVWSLGAVFYFMLTGTTPRKGDQAADPIAYVLRAPRVPIRERTPELSEEIARVIDTALDENPARRYPSAVEFREALLKASPSA